MILLDDSHSNSADPTSRLYEEPCHHWLATQSDQIDQTLADIQNALQSGIYVVTVFAYSLGEYLQGIPVRSDSIPLIEAFGFRSVSRLSQQEVSELLAGYVQPSGVLDIQASTDLEKFTQDIASIHRWIESGDTYQVNHTFQMSGFMYGTAAGLYRRLREQQPTPFGALIECQGRTILSLSPELFLSCRGRQLKAKPMKGTLAIDRHQETDLSSDEKNRTENLMIVDLIRNDLGRISEIGSVHVPAMFEVEPFGSLFQMTSTVTGTLSTDIGLRELLVATFPCGSVTGAPKKRTMEIIQSLEPHSRGVYCGAIGWFDPVTKVNDVSPPAKLGDFAMSVAIRTLEMDQHQRFHLGIGAGITIDSEPASEWNECLIKAGFVTSLPTSIGLFETMRSENGTVPMIMAHIDRIEKSAAAIGISFDRDTANNVVAIAISGLSAKDSLARVRLTLSPQGTLSAAVFPLDFFTPLDSLSTVANRSAIASMPKVFWATDLLPAALARVVSTNPLYRFKTTDRHAYDTAWQAAQAQGGFDALFVNENGSVTEGGRSNLFIRCGQQWLTPALHCGVLPGVMRAKLLSDPVFNAQEAVLSVSDVLSADEVLLVNALRGIVCVDTSALHSINL